MSTREVKVVKLTERAFKPFGSIIQTSKTKPTISRPALDYWDEIIDLGIDGNSEVGFLIVKSRPFVFK